MLPLEKHRAQGIPFDLLGQALARILIDKDRAASHLCFLLGTLLNGVSVSPAFDFKAFFLILLSTDDELAAIAVLLTPLFD